MIVKKIITFKKPTAISKFYVSVKNINGDDVVIYYGRDNHNKTLFLATQKYLTASEDPESWSFEDGTQESDM